MASVKARAPTPTAIGHPTPRDLGGPSGTVWRRRIAPVSPGPSRIHVGGGRRQSGLRVFRLWSWCPILGILHEDGHYDDLTSLPGFFGKGYFCSLCYQPYNHAGQHACTNNPTHCGGCLQNGCSDYLEAYAHYQSPTVSCPSCRRYFYGPTCVTNHLGLTHDGKPAGSGRPSVCQSRKKFRGVSNCCGDDKRGRNTAAGMPHVRPVRSKWRFRLIQVAPPPPQEEDEDAAPRSFHVFFDVKSRQEDGQHIPNLLVAETEVEDDPFRFQGETCLQQFTT